VPLSISDVLQRRSDLSTFLVHFTREGADGVSPRQNLLDILAGKQLSARSAFGMAKQHVHRDARLAESQKAVCFSETPLEHAWAMCADIEGRQVELAPYGLSITKATGRAKGLNPVWYLDMSQGNQNWLTKPVNALVDRAVAAGDYEDPIFELTPFLEQMFTWPARDQRKEFWWEREWRKTGDVILLRSDIVCVFAPAQDHANFVADAHAASAWSAKSARTLPLVDPRWSLEKMLAVLAGIDAEDAGPFPG
jgi:hypothetical protein